MRAGVAPRAQHRREGTHASLPHPRGHPGARDSATTTTPPASAPSLRRAMPPRGLDCAGTWMQPGEVGVRRRGEGAPPGLTRRTWGWVWRWGWGGGINRAETSGSTNKAQPRGDARACGTRRRAPPASLGMLQEQKRFPLPENPREDAGATPGRAGKHKARGGSGVHSSQVPRTLLQGPFVPSPPALAPPRGSQGSDRQKFCPMGRGNPQFRALLGCEGEEPGAKTCPAPPKLPLRAGCFGGA